MITSFDDARAAVGRGMSPAAAAGELVSTLTDYERLWCLDGDEPTWAGLGYLTRDDGYHRAPFPGARIERIGFPGFTFADGPRGAVIGNGTAFPVSMARGATWDPALEERVGDAIGRELRAAGATLTGAVCVNVLRHPAWGRAQETYGEDPHHVAEMGAALTRGLQRHVMACVKHFACNSMENARFSVDIEVDEVALHEVYLPHFRRIIDEGVAAVMSAYNQVNGEWCGESRSLLTDVLRREWGFERFVISDWILGLRDAATSLHGGLDVEMPYRMVRAQHLPAALQDGRASWEEVDAAATRVIATLLRFDAVLSQPAPDRAALGCAAHRALAREVAARSVVLLRNQEVDGWLALPLSASSRLAVLGRLADRVNLGDGGYSDGWDLECVTVLAGLRARFADATHDDGTDPQRAAALAATADVAVVVVGYTFEDEGEYIGETDASLRFLFPPGDEPDVVDLFEEFISVQPPTERPAHLAARARGLAVGGDRQSLRLPAADVALIRAVAAVNPRTVVVVQAGSAVVMTEWVDDVAAVVQPFYGGGQAGHGLADVLCGSVAPSARLPFSVPLDEADLPGFDRNATTFRYDRWHGWWHLARHERTPLFPFGFGLSYTTFTLAGCEVRHADAASGPDGWTVRVQVRNDGDVDGADVVQIYAALRDPEAPPRLVGFARVEVAAGASAAADINVPFTALATRDPQAHRWVAAAGEYTLRVARFATDPGALALTVAVR